VIDLNRVERRALLVVVLLVVLAAVGRTALTPGRETFAWRPAGRGVGGGEKLEALQRGVAEALRREERAHTPLAEGELIDPNTAPEEELRRLPGIGPTRARAILEQRAVQKFRHRADLLRVIGVGAATLARVAPHLALPEGASVPGPKIANGAAVTAPPSYRASNLACAIDRQGSPSRVDLNWADSATLVSLPTIGPARAVQILRWREGRGRFESVEELLEIPGIGPRTLERLLGLVCVG
jgi:competence protein ComEA